MATYIVANSPENDQLLSLSRDTRIQFATDDGSVTAWLEDGWLHIASQWEALEVRPISGNKIKVKEATDD